MTDTTPSPSASERAVQAMSEILPDWGFVPGWQITLRERITSEITEAEQAAEARGAERMRERCAHVAYSMRPTGGRQWSTEQAACFAALSDCATALAALPLEEGKG